MPCQYTLLLTLPQFAILDLFNSQEDITYKLAHESIGIDQDMFDYQLNLLIKNKPNKSLIIRTGNEGETFRLNLNFKLKHEKKSFIDSTLKKKAQDQTKKSKQEHVDE